MSQYVPTKRSTKARVKPSAAPGLTELLRKYGTDLIRSNLQVCEGRKCCHILRLGSVTSAECFIKSPPTASSKIRKGKEYDAVLVPDGWKVACIVEGRPWTAEAKIVDGQLAFKFCVVDGHGDEIDMEASGWSPNPSGAFKRLFMHICPEKSIKSHNGKLYIGCHYESAQACMRQLFRGLSLDDNSDVGSLFRMWMNEEPLPVTERPIKRMAMSRNYGSSSPGSSTSPATSVSTEDEPERIILPEVMIKTIDDGQSRTLDRFYSAPPQYDDLANFNFDLPDFDLLLFDFCDIESVFVQRKPEGSRSVQQDSPMHALAQEREALLKQEVWSSAKLAFGNACRYSRHDRLSSVSILTWLKRQDFSKDNKKSDEKAILEKAVDNLVLLAADLFSSSSAECAIHMDETVEEDSCSLQQFAQASFMVEKTVLLMIVAELRASQQFEEYSEMLEKYISAYSSVTMTEEQQHMCEDFINGNTKSLVLTTELPVIVSVKPPKAVKERDVRSTFQRAVQLATQLPSGGEILKCFAAAAF